MVVQFIGLVRATEKPAVRRSCSKRGATADVNPYLHQPAF